MKIAIMGTHGIGKTTLAQKLNTILKDAHPEKRVRVTPELARMCPFPVNENMSENSQRWLFHAQIKMEMEYAGMSDIVICDRTVIDGLAYAMWAGLYEFVSDHLPVALSWFDTYDRVFWLRPKGHHIFYDGFRSVDADFQVGVDQYLKELVESNDLPVDRRATDLTADDFAFIPPTRPS